MLLTDYKAKSMATCRHRYVPIEHAL